MMLRYTPIERRGQLGRRRPQAAVPKAREFQRICLARDQALEHRPAALADDVGDHRIELDVRRFQRLLDALDVRNALAHELLARAHQGAKVIHLARRNEARLDETMRNQLGEPRCVVHVCLAAGHILHMRRIDQDQLEILVRKNVPHRLPVDPGRLHRRACHALRREPLAKRNQLRRRRRKRSYFRFGLGPDHATNTGNHRRLVHVEAGTRLMQQFHHTLLQSAAGMGHSMGKSGKRAPGPNRSMAQSGVLQVPRVQLTRGFANTKKRPTSKPTDPNTLNPFHALRVGGTPVAN